MSGKNTEASRAKLLVAGAQKHFSNASSLAFGGETFTPGQAVASLQTLADLRTGVDDAKAATKAKVVAEAAQAPALRRQMAAFVLFVKATFGNSPDVLADFGLKPRQAATPLTVEQKAAAAAKREATRKARNTMGTKQKKLVNGTITTIVSPTPSTAANPVVAPSPVASVPAQPAGGASAVAAPHVP